MNTYQTIIAEMSDEELFCEWGDAEFDYNQTDNCLLINVMNDAERELSSRGWVFTDTGEYQVVPLAL